MRALTLLASTLAHASALRLGAPLTLTPSTLRSRPAHLTMVQPAAAAATAAAAAAAAALTGAAQPASAARSGGRVGGRVGGGGGGGYGGGYGGGGRTVIVQPPPVISPFGFSPFGYGFGFSPFGFGGFGLGFGLPFPLLLFALGGLALTTFRSSRGIEAVDDEAGAAYCLQVACYCGNRQDSLYGKLNSLARKADTDTYEGLQQLVSDACLAMLRSSKDWLAANTKSEVKGVFKNDVDSQYNRIVVTERSKWEKEQTQLTRTAPGQPTYMVATLVVLLRQGSPLPSISGVTDVREAISQVAADVSVEDNLIAAEVLWTPDDSNDVMDRDDMYLNFPELVTI